MALNVSVDLDWFERIVACGVADRGVTSMKRLGSAAPLLEVAGRLAREFGAVFGRDVTSLDAHSPPSVASVAPNLSAR